MATVDIRGVRKAYGTTAVIHGVDVSIRDGEFVVLVGPSGCGKSTLLRMIAGLENITGGQILINNRVVNDVPPKERDIAMVFQNYALYPHMTVGANMGFSLHLRKARNPRSKPVKRAADILGLAHLLDRFRASSRRPAPARRHGPGHRARPAGVPVRRAAVQSRCQAARADAHEIKELHQRLKTTTVYVTHDQIEAMTMADKIVVMHDGVVDRSARRSISTTHRPTCSWPASSALRR